VITAYLQASEAAGPPGEMKKSRIQNAATLLVLLWISENQ